MPGQKPQRPTPRARIVRTQPQDFQGVQRALDNLADAIELIQRQLAPFTDRIGGFVPAPVTEHGYVLSDNGTWIAAGAISGAVSSVTAGSAQVSVSPTAGAVIVDVVPGNFTGIPEGGITGLVADLAARPTGSGTTNKVTKWSGSTTLTDSSITDTGALVTVANPLTVTGATILSTTLTVSLLTAGSVPFIGTAGLVSQDNSNLFWDSTNKKLGIGTNTFSDNTAFSGTTVPYFEMTRDGAINTAMVSAFGAGSVFPQFYFLRGRGTRAAPTAVLTGDTLGLFGGAGYGDGTINKFGGSSNIQFFADGDWTTSSHAGGIKFTTVPSGSTNGVLRVRIGHNGNVNVGSTDSDPGVALRVEGNATITANLTANGNVSIGDAGTDAHALLGTLNANSTAGTNGQALKVVSGVPQWTSAIVNDANYGDVTVSSSGAVWTVNNAAITYAKIQNVSATSRILGRITAGAGSIEELTGTQATTLLDAFTSSLKGLAPSSGGGTTTFLRADGTWAAPTAVLGDGAYGDVTVSGTGTVMTIATYAGSTKGLVPAGAGSTTKFLREDGNWAAATGGGGSVADGDYGDVVVSGTGAVWTIDTNVVTYAKMQDVSATSRFIGRITAGAGDPEELTGTQATTLLDAVTTSVKGLVPTAPNDVTKYLDGTGAWSVPQNNTYVNTTKTSDTFNRANSTTSLGSTDGSNALDPIAWTQVNGTWGILSNTAYTSATGAGTQINYAYVALSAGMQNMFVQATLSTVNATNGTSMGIMIGQDNSNYVVLYCNRSGGGVNTYVLQKNVAGTGATVFSITTNGVGAPTPANGDVLRLERVQYCIYRAYINGTFVCAVALNDNSTFVSTVRCGIAETTTGGTTSGARLDSFSAGTTT